MPEDNEKIIVAAFYRFVDLPDYEELKQPLLEFCKSHEMMGTILLASEGINSTISATRANMDAFFAWLDRDSRLANMERKEHICDYKPFERMKVRLKREIVRLGVDGLDLRARGEYIDSGDWDTLISDPDVAVIDTRNKYEVQVGRFANAIDPETDDFRSFPQWAEENLDPGRHKKVAMYCTGGIRCEKSTSLLKSMGFEEVYHLKGGILQYLADTGNKSGAWQGDCFVFDSRVAVDKDLHPSETLLCKYCSTPLTTDDIRWGGNQKGASCNSCAEARSAVA